jgi:predicted metal-dependent hydrolase
MMPEWVLDYVVAHEVAHLEVMNHSPRFWRIVEKLSGQVKEANDWLRRHGAEVHRYG